MNDATKVREALKARADALDGEADEMMERDYSARANAGNASMKVFIKKQVAQEFRNLAEELTALG